MYLCNVLRSGLSSIFKQYKSQDCEIKAFNCSKGATPKFLVKVVQYLLQFYLLTKYFNNFNFYVCIL